MITSINGRPVDSLEEWNRQLNSMLLGPSFSSPKDGFQHPKQGQNGFCVSATFLAKHSNSISAPCSFERCCEEEDSDDDDETAGRKLCFLLHTALSTQTKLLNPSNKQSEKEESPNEDQPPPFTYNKGSCDLPQALTSSSNLQQYVRWFVHQEEEEAQPYTKKEVSQQGKHVVEDKSEFLQNFSLSHRKACLAVRPVTEEASQLCTTSADCAPTYFGPGGCLQAFHPTQASARLLVISLEARHPGANILFWGPPRELLQVVRVSSLRPRLSLLPLALPEQLDVFFRYLSCPPPF